MGLNEVGEREDGRAVGCLEIEVVGSLVRKTVGYDDGIDEDGRDEG